jgi:hypothetical protein
MPPGLSADVTPSRPPGKANECGRWINGPLGVFGADKLAELTGCRGPSYAALHNQKHALLSGERLLDFSTKSNRDAASKALISSN